MTDSKPTAPARLAPVVNVTGWMVLMGLALLWLPATRS
jgi:hypothetical protein